MVKRRSYKRGGGGETDDGSCAICGRDSTIGNLCNIVPCNDVICRDCYYQIKNGNNRCPFCRRQMTGLMCNGQRVDPLTSSVMSSAPAPAPAPIPIPAPTPSQNQFSSMQQDNNSWENDLIVQAPDDSDDDFQLRVPTPEGHLLDYSDESNNVDDDEYQIEAPSGGRKKRLRRSARRSRRLRRSTRRSSRRSARRSRRYKKR